MIRSLREKNHYLKVLGLKAPINLLDLFPEKKIRILITGRKRIGDMIAAIPAIHSIKKNFPQSHITVLSATDHGDILRPLPFINEFRILPEDSNTISQIASEFDLVFSFQKWDVSSDFPKYTVPCFFLSTDLLLGEPKLAHIHYTDTLRLLGINSKTRRPKIILSDQGKSFGRRFFTAFSFDPEDIIVAVHAGSGYAGKRWPQERFKATIEWLDKCYKAKFVFIQGKNEENLVKKMMEVIPEENAAILSEVPLQEVAGVLALCTFYLGNDSGIMHIADTVGCPTLTVFGPSRPKVWGATNPNSVYLVREDVWWSCPYCSGRNAKDKPCNRKKERACLKAISVHDVCGGIESLASLIGLRKRFTHLDSIKITQNLCIQPLGPDGIVLTNLETMRPLYISQGKSTIQSCLEKVRESGSYSSAIQQDRNRQIILDALLTYRILLPIHDCETEIDPDQINIRKNLLSNPLIQDLGSYTMQSAQKSVKASYALIKQHGIQKRTKLNQGKKKLRILFVNTIHPSIYGGGEKWMIKVGKSLMKRGHHVMGWGLRDHRWLADAQEFGLLPLSEEVPLILDFKDLPHFVEYLKRLRIDAAILNLDRDVISVGIPLRLAGVPIILGRKGLAHIDENPLVRWAYNNVTDGIITPSESMRQKFIKNIKLTPNSIITIHNGVEPKNYFTPSSEKKIIKGELGIKREDKVILTIGRLVKQKGTRYLIQSLPMIQKRFPNVRLLIVGKGPEERNLKKSAAQLEITDRVHFLGERWDVARLFSAADCFILPSLYEGMSTALLEAMAAGIPIIATAIDGNTEVLQNKKNGILIPPKNSREITKAVCLIFSDNQLRKRLTRNAKERVKKHYVFDKMIDSVEKVFFDRL